MTKQVKEVYTDLSGKITVEYSDDSIRIVDPAKRLRFFMQKMGLLLLV
jgi:hypothetical protein